MITFLLLCFQQVKRRHHHVSTYPPRRHPQSGFGAAVSRVNICPAQNILRSFVEVVVEKKYQRSGQMILGEKKDLWNFLTRYLTQVGPCYEAASLLTPVYRRIICGLKGLQIYVRKKATLKHFSPTTASPVVENADNVTQDIHISFSCYSIGLTNSCAFSSHVHLLR